MFRNVSRSIYVLRRGLPYTPLFAKRTFVTTNVLKATKVDHHGGETSGKAPTELRKEVAASSCNGNIYQRVLDSAPLSEDAFLKLISARQAHWMNNDLVSSAAHILSMNVEKLAQLLSEHPRLMLLQEVHLMQLISTSFENQNNLIRAEWRGVEKNIELMARYGIETYRLRIAKWIWLNTFASHANRLEIDTCPEVRAMLWSYSDKSYKRIKKKIVPKAMTENFQALFSTFQQYLGTTDSYEMLYYLQKYEFLFWAPIERMRRLFEMMLNAGVQREQIKKDLWVLRHNTTIAEKRLNEALAANLPTIKPWMLRCSPKTLHDHIRLNSGYAAAITPHLDLVDFLAEKLCCTRNEIEMMKSRYPLVTTVRPPKIAQGVKYLLEEGYSPEEIRSYPRVLTNGHERLKARIEVFKAASNGQRKPKLKQLIITPKNFDRILTKMKYDLVSSPDTPHC